jgi:hypothetical protein
LTKTETALPQDPGFKTLSRRISLLSLKLIFLYLLGITIALAVNRRLAASKIVAFQRSMNCRRAQYKPVAGAPAITEKNLTGDASYENFSDTYFLVQLIP